MQMLGEIIKVGLIVFGAITCVAIIAMAIPGNTLTGLVRELAKRVGATAVTTVYVLSPIDLVPDVALGLGQLDDLLAVGLLLYYWYTLFTAERTFRRHAPPRPSPPPDRLLLE